MSATVVITGVFSYTGKYTTRLLPDRGYRVRTLTNHPPAVHQEKRQNPHVSQNRRDVGHPPDVEPGPGPFGGQVEVFPHNFDRPEELRPQKEPAVRIR